MKGITNMFKILKRLKNRDWLMILGALVFIVFQVWLDLRLPEYMKEITTLLQTPNTEMKDIWHAGLMMFACALGSFFIAVIAGFFTAKIAASISKSLRGDIFEKVHSFSFEEIGKFSTPSLITRSTNDINQIQMVISMGLIVLVRAPVMAIWASMKILTKNWQWTAATGGAIILIVVLITVITLFAIPKFKVVQTYTDNLNRVTRENLTGIRVIRAYNAEDYQNEKFEKHNTVLYKTHLFIGKIMSLIDPVMATVMSGINLSIYYIGAYLIEAAGMESKIDLFSDTVVFSSYAMMVIMSFLMLTFIFFMLPRASVSAKRINEVLDTEPRIHYGDYKGNDIKGEIEFRNVNFKYPDAGDYVLEDISFKANKGETIAIIGSTGSGKSSLINLIPRFFDVTSGEVLIDGVNVKEYDKKALLDKIGYVSQKAVLFSGTVRSNIEYGNNPENGDSAVEKAIEIAQGKEFINEKTGGIDAVIAQSGQNLSGGQKQRISIARAIHRNSEILIFDDSFSALDYKTDKQLRHALNKHTSNSTVFIVAQRIGTIKDADKIIVLDEGRAVGIGTHRELINNCEVYREIALSQLSKEELEDVR